MAQVNLNLVLSRRRWFSDTGWLLGANLARNLGLIVVMVALARFTTPTIVGEYSLALAITTPIFIFAQLGLKGVYLTHKRNFKLRFYIIVQTLSLLFALIISIIIGQIFFPGLFEIIILAAFIKLIDSYSDLFSSPLQAYGSSAWIFLGFLASSIIGALAASITLLVSAGNLEVTLLSLAVASIVSAAFLLWLPALLVAHKNEKAIHNHEVNSSAYKVLITASIPAGVGGALLALVASFPQYLLALSWGKSSVGLYAILFYIVMIADIFIGTLAQGWILRAKEANKESQDSQKSFFRYTLRTGLLWCLLFLPLSIFGVLLASKIIPTVFGAQYYLNVFVAIPIVASILVSPILNFTNMAIIVRNLYIHNITLSATSVLVSLISGIFLIQQFGVAGAFWTFAIASAARTIPGLILVYRDESKLKLK